MASSTRTSRKASAAERCGRSYARTVDAGVRLEASGHKRTRGDTRHQRPAQICRGRVREVSHNRESPRGRAQSITAAHPFCACAPRGFPLMPSSASP
uniref:Uncharacterized protein n=1 Tax=Knipowitschia caucasica TaxID=637954 RepID=A0AAV2JKQ0_KNICA